MADQCKVLTKLVAKCNHPRVLYLDAYDSFANNIIDMLEKLLSAKVYVLKIFPGMSTVDFVGMIRDFDAIIAGPGPGSPTNPADVGIMREVWRLSEDDLRPVLGISLGFQSLAHTFGAKIERLKDAKHGIVSQVVHGEESIFRGLSGIKVTRYHSLEVKLDPPDHPAHEEEYMLWDPKLLWEPRPAIPDLQPLAWVVAEHKDDAILMAVRHVEKPFWGIQFHVDSAASDKQSRKVITNWWAEVARWHQRRYGAWYWASSRAPHRIVTYLQRWLDRRERDLVLELPFERHLMNGILARQWRDSRGPREVLTQTLHWPWSSDELLRCVDVGYDGCDAVVLDTAGSEVHSRYTIIGLVVPQDQTTIEYFAGAREVKIVRQLHGNVHVDTWCLDDFNDDFWEFLSRYMSSLRNFYGREDSPFWGGLMGYVSHEMGLVSIGVDPLPVTIFGEHGQRQPDISFAFIERSVVLDHDLQMAFVQTMAPNDSDWMNTLTDTLGNGPISFSVFDEWTESPSIMDRKFRPSHMGGERDIFAHPVGMQVSAINGDVYKQRVEQCRELILDGHSHGLCLATQATMRLPRPRWRNHAWHMYRHMRLRNDPLFGAFYNVGSTTILSLSNERFLDMGPSVFQMRPFRGPLCTPSPPTGDELKRWRRETRELAKHLTVVDVIRHDMLGVLGTGAVYVPQLRHVDASPEGLHILSVVEGSYIKPAELSEPMGSTQEENDAMRRYKQGYRLLATSLPPAHLTGAPKKRSCEILKCFEVGNRRGIYSGIMGYLCVSGRGDFSMMERTATKWSHDQGADWPVYPTPASAPGSTAVPESTPGSDENSAPGPSAARASTSAPDRASAPDAPSTHERKPASKHTPPYSFSPRSRASSTGNTSTWSWANIENQPHGVHMLHTPVGKAKAKQVRDIGVPTGPFDYWRFGSNSTVTAVSDPDTDLQEMRDELDRILGPFVSSLKQVAAFGELADGGWL
ncbi:MAG: para-aminobenzoate synthase, (PABA) [Lichina confinis]|nr:MAG: para-aminobenzoate synthase, (PABA) [Lichina confinis]